MPITVTRTKIVLPRRRSDLLSRQRLVDALYDLMDCKLIIVAAPAGYGKTSLIIDFAHQAEFPACWYALDPLDRDIRRFLTYFIAAIRQRFPTFGQHSISALEGAGSGELDLDRMVTTVVNDAYENIQEHFLIVLDDYHLLNSDDQVDYFINRFVQDVDENCHLILVSRALLTLPDMPLMVARSQVGGLSFEELAFRPEEIQSLVLQNYQSSMPDAIAEELIRETEGWITGLLLTAHTKWDDMTNLLRVARVSGIGLYEYLAQQVLDRQPQSSQDFLLRTSLLEEFDSGLCRAVFGEDQDWGMLIEYTLQNNLFVLPVGEDGGWIRYHHLFRDFLQARFKKDFPEQHHQILHKLVDIYVQRNEWEKAYSACQRLGDVAITVRFIERVGSAMITHARITSLAEWIDGLPESTLNNHPNLLSLRGAVAINQGKLEQGLSFLNQAALAHRAAGDQESLALTLVRRASAHRFMGRFSSSLEDASEALNLTKTESVPLQVKAEALRAIGMSQIHLGNLEQAVVRLQESLNDYNSLHDRQNVTTVLMELGLAYLSSSSYREAMTHFNLALTYWREVQNMVGQVYLINNLAILHHLQGEYERAAELFSDGLALAKFHGMKRMEAYILCGIGDLYADLDAVEAAVDAYEHTRSFAEENEDLFLLTYLNLMEAGQARNMGEIEKARRLLKSTEKLVQESASEYETGLWQMEEGRLDLAEGDYQAAKEHFNQSTSLFDKGGQRVEAARAYLYLATANYLSNYSEEANNNLTRALDIASGMDSQHVLVVAGRWAKPLLKAAQSYPSLGSQASHLYKKVTQFERSIPTFRRRLRPHATAIQFVPPKLTIRALGKAIVELDGKPVTAVEWQNQRRARELFFCLLAHPQGLTKDTLGLIFWPESSAGQLKMQFKNTIYRIRHALGQEVLQFDGDRYWFNSDLDYEYDVETFTAKVSAGQTEQSRSERIVAYHEAIDLYQGHYLPEIDGSWVSPERERLGRMYEEAILELAHLHLEGGEYLETLEYCQRVLAEDPCLEEAHRLMMRAYAARGNQAEVTRQYDRCRKALLEEVGAQPSSQTVSLYVKLTS